MKLRLLILMLIPFQMVFSQTVPVTFIYTNKTARNVYLAGNINSWNMSDPGYKLTDSNGDGTFEFTTNLAKGNHQYKFVVDGAWLADPNNPVTDGTEYNNSLITVSDPMVTYLLPVDTIEYKISKAPLITAIVAFGNTTTIGFSNLSLKINNVSVPISSGNYNQTTKIFTYQSLSSQLV
ncbi:MAG: glycogen-binding domain-containing protein, partial [Bacteroidota bacterium]|nr:glycogen-binding domain-containing protein [Bacteroidota bacterium]